MEVAPPLPPQAVDFNFDSACSSPYISAPSSPRRSGAGGGIFFSAPTSPRLASNFFRHLNNLSLLDPTGNRAASPARSESKIPTYGSEDDEDGAAEFEFSGQLDPAYALSAEELFDGGKIKPLGVNYAADLGNSMRISARSLDERPDEWKNGGEQKQSHRGRSERFVLPSSSSSSHSSARKGSRSLSPFRVSDSSFDREERCRKAFVNRKPPPASSSPSSSANSNSSVSSSMGAAAAATATSSKGSKKWKLRDLLLFRSASEGRASTSGKDPLRKFYAPLLSKKSSAEDLKAASFRSTESGTGSSRRRNVPGSARSSAHELHYRANRAVSEEMRRRTFLPYKPDLLGCLGFSSVSSVHEISRGIGSLTRG